MGIADGRCAERLLPAVPRLGGEHRDQVFAARESDRRGDLFHQLRRPGDRPDRGARQLAATPRLRTSYLWFIAVIVGGLAREERDRAVEYTEIVRLHSDLEQARAALEHQALHDTLTGLANRRRFDAWLRESVEIAHRATHEVALLVLDRFKEVNDTLGHQVGDDLLRQVASRLRGAVRAGDLVARLGGDEFALVLPRAGLPEAAATARRVLAALAEPVTLVGRPIGIGGSIGIALFPTDAHDPAMLLQRADLAMYAAKRGQRGYTRFVASPADEAGAPAAA
jgi:diguanylate cyclase (GGDEF)-like protein